MFDYLFQSLKQSGLVIKQMGVIASISLIMLELFIQTLSEEVGDGKEPSKVSFSLDSLRFF